MSRGPRRWQDLRFPAAGINPPGAASDPGRDTTDGCLVFDAAATEIIAIQVQWPHGIDQFNSSAGFEFEPHIHWQRTTSASGNVLWRLQYKKCPYMVEEDADWTVLNVTTPIANSNTAKVSMISSFGRILLPNTQVRDSDMMKILISRIGGDGTDTYGADAKLLEFDIHVPLIDYGSYEIYGDDDR